MEPIAKLFENVAQSPSAVSNLLYFQCFSYYLPSRGRLGYSFAIGSMKRVKSFFVVQASSLQPGLGGMSRPRLFAG